jgi:hypothetical protein
MGGSGGQGQAPGGGQAPRVQLNIPLGSGQLTPEGAIENALTSFRLNDQTGRRDVPDYTTNPSAIHSAITRVLEQYGDNEQGNTMLRSHQPALWQQMNERFGQEALDAWLNQSGNVLNHIMNPAQQRQISRLMRLSGTRPSPISVLNEHAPMTQRFNPLGLALQGFNLLRDYVTK